MNKNICCFIDVDGYIWSVADSGESNYPGDIEVKGDKVVVFEGSECNGRAVVKEYKLWNSLTSMAMEIEQKVPSSEDGSVTLEQAVAEAHQRAESFKKFWLTEHARKPEHFPLALPADNAGLWFEQINDHEPED